MSGGSAGRLGGTAMVLLYSFRSVMAVFWRNKKSLVGLIIVITFVLIAVLAPYESPYNPTGFSTGPAWQPPSLAHPMGTDYVGHDLWSQFVWGARISLEVGFLAGAMVQILGNTLGILSGYIGGKVDDGLMRIVDIFLTLPTLPLIILLIVFLPFHGPLVVTLVIVITSWAGHTRNMRAQSYSYRERDFILAAKASGYGSLRISFSEIFPNILSLAMAGMMYSIVAAIGAEAGLDFLGLASGNTVSWGTMLYWAQSEGAIINGTWWWIVPPGLALALIGFGLVMMNYAFDELFNPRLRVL